MMMMTSITTLTMLWKRVLKRLSESQLNLELDGEEGGRYFPHRFRCPSETKLVTKRSENLLGLLILTVWMTHHSKTQISSHVPSALSRGHLYLCVISWYKRYIAVLSNYSFYCTERTFTTPKSNNNKKNWTRVLKKQCVDNKEHYILHIQIMTSCRFKF